MNVSELRYQIEQVDPETHFFDRKTMRFFGDTMRNYGVRSTTVETWSGETFKCWELHRKRPVKHGLSKSAYFDKTTFKAVHSKD